MPIVQGDLESLPFHDKAFDYVICTHVLEHVDDPAQACRELIRVAKAGYIETPSELNERLFGGGPIHKWMISLSDNGTLRFRQKPRPYMDEWVAAAIWRMRLQRNVGLEAFIRHNANLLYTIVTWQGQFSFEVVPDPDGYQGKQDIADQSASNEQTRYEARPNLVVWKSLAHHLLAPRRKQSVDLLAVLACPICRGNLQRDQDMLLCRQCQVHYRIKDGIPRLLRNEALPVKEGDNS